MNEATPSASTRKDRFHAVFEAEFAYVWTSLRRLGVEERDAEDVAHDLFLEVYRQIDRYDERRPVRPWLFAFAFRFASDYRRRARHRVEVLGDHDADASDATVARADALLERKDAQRVLLAALEKIDEGRRAVFVLHELDECPMQEIADSLDLPVNTAWSRLRLARQEFQNAIHRLVKKGESR